MVQIRTKRAIELKKKVVYEREVPIEEIDGPVYFLREDKTPLSQQFHETIAIASTPGFDTYYEGTKVEYFKDRWYEQEVRYLPGIPPRKTFSSTVFYIPVNGKKHIWFRDSCYLRFDLPSPKSFSTKVFLYPRRKVESHVTGVEHTDEKVVKYYRVAVDLQLRDYVSLELVPIDQ